MLSFSPLVHTTSAAPKQPNVRFGLQQKEIPDNLTTAKFIIDPSGVDKKYPLQINPGDEPILLSPQQAKLLVYLIGRPNTVISYDELCAHMSSPDSKFKKGTIFTPNHLKVLVFSLRSKLNPTNSSGRHFINTIKQSSHAMLSGGYEFRPNGDANPPTKEEVAIR